MEASAELSVAPKKVILEKKKKFGNLCWRSSHSTRTQMYVLLPWHTRCSVCQMDILDKSKGFGKAYRKRFERRSKAWKVIAGSNLPGMISFAAAVGVRDDMSCT